MVQSSSYRVIPELLTLHPWLSSPLLEHYYGGKSELLDQLHAYQNLIGKCCIPDIGDCFAVSDELQAGVLGLRRVEMVRHFVSNVMGIDTLNKGYSPTPNADGEFLWDGRWYRVWGDIGIASPESLQFIRKPPETFGEYVYDLIVVPDRPRMDTVAAQVELNWRGKQEVTICAYDSDYLLRVKPNRVGSIRPWKMDSKIKSLDFDAVLEERCSFLANKMRRYQQASSADRSSSLSGLRPQRTKAALPEIAISFGNRDWDTLVFIGNNPYMTWFEICNALGVDVSLSPASLNTPGSGIPDVKEMSERFLKLYNHGLLHELKTNRDDDIKKSRFILGWRGLALLMEDWGVDRDDFGQFHPWPTKVDEDGRRAYSGVWLVKMEDHQTLCRQFALSLLLLGRRLSNGVGKVDVTIETTIGSRILMQNTYYDNDLQWVSPDAKIDISMHRKRKDAPSGDFEELVNHVLYVEIDRATNPLTRIAEKFDKYKKVVSVPGERKPVLVWVIDGPPSREKRIIDEMNKAGVTGWTVMLDRLRLEHDDEWWDRVYERGESVLEQEAIGDMSPFRKIWMSTSSEYRLLPFLGHEPWVLGPMSKNKGRPPQIYETYRQW